MTETTETVKTTTETPTSTVSDVIATGEVVAEKVEGVAVEAVEAVQEAATDAVKAVEEVADKAEDQAEHTVEKVETITEEHKTWLRNELATWKADFLSEIKSIFSPLPSASPTSTAGRETAEVVTQTTEAAAIVPEASPSSPASPAPLTDRARRKGLLA